MRNGDLLNELVLGDYCYFSVLPEIMQITEHVHMSSTL